MKCTKCNNEMIKGYIYGDRYALKWKADDKKLFGGIWATKGIKFKKNSGIFGRPKTESYMCNCCNTIIIDLNTQSTN